MNTLVQFFRSQFPQDTRTDEEVTLLYGDSYGPQGLESFPDAVSDYQRLSQSRRVESATIGGELKSGIKRGFYGLESTGAGALSLTSDLLGAKGARDWWMEVAQKKAQEAGEEPAAVPKIQDVSGLRTGLLYTSGKLGELVPNIAEIGAVAATGGAAAPEVLAARGLAGLVERKAAESLAKRLGESAIKREIAQVAAGAERSILSKTAETELAKEIGTTAKRWGGKFATFLNFAAQGAGGIYETLRQTPGVSEDQATAAALAGGLASSVGGLLPVEVLNKFFPKVSASVSDTYLKRLAKDVPKDVLLGSSGMGAMELASIAAEKYADPAKRDTPLSHDDWSRLLNAGVLGALAGVPGAAIGAIPGPRAEPKTEPPPPPPPPKEPLEPGQKPPGPLPAQQADLVKKYTGGATPEQTLRLKEIAQKEAGGTTPSAAEREYLNSLPEGVRTLYPQLLKEAQDAATAQKVKEGVSGKRKRDDAQLHEDEKAGNLPAQVQEEGTQTGARDRLSDQGRVSRLGLLTIANELFTRLRDIKRTPEQEDRFRAVSLLVSSPTEEKLQGLASALALTLDDTARTLPDRFKDIPFDPKKTIERTVSYVAALRQMAEEESATREEEERAGAVKRSATKRAAVLQAIREMDTEKFRKLREKPPKQPPSPEPAAPTPEQATLIQELRPAIKTMATGELIPGDQGQVHNDIIAENKLKAEDIDRRTFVDAQGNEHSRQEVAALPGVNTDYRPGEAHAPDLAKAQGELSKTSALEDLQKEGLRPVIAQALVAGEITPEIAVDLNLKSMSLKEGKPSPGVSHQQAVQMAREQGVTAVKDVLKKHGVEEPKIDADKLTVNMAKLSQQLESAPPPISPGKEVKEQGQSAATKQSRNWDAFYEELAGNLDSFSPARTTGRPNYELQDVAQRFVDYAKGDTSGKSLTDLAKDFAKNDEASVSQIRKLKAALKDLETPPKAGEPAKAPAAEPPKPSLPKVGDVIEYKQGWPNPKTVRGKVVELRKNPVPGGEPIIPVVEVAPGKTWPVAEWFETGKVVEPAAEPPKVDTIAGRMDLTEFEKKGYSPEQVTKEDWRNLQRAERRRLGQDETNGNPNAPWSDYDEFHKQAIKDALARGEKVDPQVLADYPDLAPVEAKPTKSPQEIYEQRRKNLNAFRDLLLREGKAESDYAVAQTSQEKNAILERVLRGRNASRNTKDSYRSSLRRLMEAERAVEEPLAAKTSKEGTEEPTAADLLNKVEAKPLSDLTVEGVKIGVGTTQQAWKQRVIVADRKLSESARGLTKNQQEQLGLMSSTLRVAMADRLSYAEKLTRKTFDDVLKGAEADLRRQEAEAKPPAGETPAEHREITPGMSIAQKEEILGGLIRDKILNAPSFPKLLAAAKAAEKSIHGKLREDFVTVSRQEPWDLLSAHAGIMNAKSARAVTLKRLANAVIDEAGLPMNPRGKFRGEDFRVDWDKLAEQQKAPSQPAKPVSVGPGEAKHSLEPEVNVAQGDIDPRHQQLWTEVTQALADSGLSVHVTNDRLRLLSQGVNEALAPYLRGAYFPERQLVMLYVGDAIGRPQLEAALEESAHAMFFQESPEMKDTVLKAIAKLKDPLPAGYEELGLNQGAVSEERMAHRLAARLAEQGFSPQQSSGIAQSLVRLVKDIYFRSLMWLQQTVLGDQYTNSDLAERYLQNRLERFLAGDKDTLSWIDRLGGGEPVAAREVRWLSPSGVSEVLGERWNASTGQVDYAPVLNDTVEAARFNAREAVRYSLANAGDPNAPYVEPSVLLNRQAAANNELADVRGNALKAAGMSKERFRVLFGKVPNTDDIAAEIARQAQAAQAEKFNPDQRYGDFAHADNFKHAGTDAYLALGHESRKIQEHGATAAERVDDLTTKRNAVIERNRALILTYPDAEEMTRQAVPNLRKLVVNTLREVQNASRRLGVIGQQLAELEGRQDEPIPASYSSVFQKLFTGDQLKGDKLFDFLDLLANDDSLDFTKSIAQIRSDMKARGIEYTPYEKLTQDTPESKALLATVVAYAKTDQRLMSMLEVRRMKVGAEKEQLTKTINDLMKGKQVEIGRKIGQLAKSVKLTERTRAAFRDALDDIKTLNRGIDRSKEIKDAAEKMFPYYRHAQEQLAEKFGLGSDLVFADGAKVAVPPTPNAKRDAWEPFEIRLTGPDKLTSEQLNGVMEKLAAYVRNQDNLYKQGNKTAHGYDYNTALNSLSELYRHRYWDPIDSAVEYHKFELMFQPEPKRFYAIGTAQSRNLAKMWDMAASDFGQLRPGAVRVGERNQGLQAVVIRSLNRGRPKGLEAVTARGYYDNILQPALEFMQGQHDIGEMDIPDAEKLNTLYQRLGNYLLKNERLRAYTGDNPEPFLKALRDHIESIYESGQGFHRRAQEVEEGYGVAAGITLAPQRVKDLKLGGVRRPIETGLRTFQKKAGKIKDVINALRNSGWELLSSDEAGGGQRNRKRAEFSTIKELLDQQKDQDVQGIENRYFHNSLHGDSVMRLFVGEIAHKPGDSWFDAPVLADGVTRPPADPQKVSDAFDNSGGSIVKFAQNMFAAHGGESDPNAYVQEVFVRFADIFDDHNGSVKKTDDPSIRTNSLVGLLPDVFLDARQFPDAPAGWYYYHTFDRIDALRVSQRVAAQRNFGRRAEGLEKAMQNVEAEIQKAKAELSKTYTTAGNMVFTGKKKSIEEQAAKLLPGGKDELHRLQRLVKMQTVPTNARKQLLAYFRDRFDPDITQRWPIKLAQLIATGQVNQFTSAMVRLATIFDPMMQYGVSGPTLKFAWEVASGTAKDIAGGLIEGIGFEAWKNSYWDDAYERLGLKDPLAARKFAGALQPMGGEESRPFALRAIRTISDLYSTGLNPKGEQARFSVPRPLEPFGWIYQALNKGGTGGMWNFAKRFLTDSVKAREAHPEGELTAERMGYSGLTANSFNLFKRDIQRYGLTFEDMANGLRERMANGDKRIMTDSEMSRLYSIWLGEVCIESSFASMPLRAFNDTILRFSMPLLGWGYRRALQVTNLRLDAEGKNSIRAAGNGLLALSAVGMGGLAISLLIDDYSEKLLGKKKDLQRLRLPTTAEDVIGINERLARMGTIGMFGELANSAINVATGSGDNRGFSFDGRVVAMQSFHNVLRMLSALYNQNGTVDYQHIIRPLLQSIGGNGLLQYQDLANHTFDFDNAEARVVRRINAENYLRVTGREMGLSVRTNRGGYSTPTPLTPWISRMEYAAYANNPEDFSNAYQGALAEAVRAGKPDPEDFVKRSFESRNPIKYVFNPSPTEAEYRQVLSELDERGYQAVTEAVNAFNHYASQLGAKPYEGKSETRSTKKALDLNTIRSRALAGFGTFK